MSHFNSRPTLALQCSQCFLLCHSWCFFRSEQSPGHTTCPFKQSTSSDNLTSNSGGGKVGGLSPGMVSQLSGPLQKKVSDGVIA